MNSESVMLDTFRDMMSLAQVLMVNTVIDPECYAGIASFLENLLSKWQETWVIARAWLLETELDSIETIQQLLDRVPCSEKIKSVFGLSLQIHFEFWQQVFYNLKFCQQALRNETLRKETRE
jgi:hypothetical protein